MIPTTVEPSGGEELQRHPAGLYALFATEMWERVSYYGMRALLVLYLVRFFKLDEPGARAIYGIYTGLVYLTPLIGGRLADRYLGQRKAIFIGGTLMALGQFALTRPELLNLGLGLLIVGNGFFKPNISTMVGTLYPQHDPRRDGAYTIFYMGINLGAFIAPLICGWLGERKGWDYGFAAAGIGMVLGLVTFVFTQRLLKGQGLPPGRPVVDQAVLQAKDWAGIALGVLVGVAFVWGGLAAWPQIRMAWSPSFLEGGPVWAGVKLFHLVWKGGLLIGLLALFLWATESRAARAAVEHGHSPLTKEEWQRLAVIVTFSLFSIVFWMGFEQSGGTLNLFADSKTNRMIGNWELPTSWLQAVNPLFIISFAPVFAVIWTAMARRNVPFSSFAKFGLGLIGLSLAFAVMFIASQRAESGKVSWLWLVAVYFIFTVAELMVSPIGLSLVNKLAPKRLSSLMMAFWFLCTAAANYLAAIVHDLVTPNGWNLWKFLGLMALVPGLLMLALTPLLEKMSHGRS